MIELLLQSLKPFFGEIGTGLVTMLVMWFLNRKKQDIDNNQSIVDLYQDSLTDLKNRYEEKYLDLKITFDGKLNRVLEKMAELEKSLDEWKKKYYNLKKDFDKYKSEHP